MKLDDEEYYRGRRLDRLMYTAVVQYSTLDDQNARRHIYEGLLRRLGMIEASWTHLRELHHREKSGPLSVFEATDAGIHVNAYYLNLCGALDNLAWALQHEHAVVPGIHETHQKRVRISLFGKEFVRGVEHRWPRLSPTLTAYTDWNVKLRDLRDPAAHRIPIYVPPGVVDESTGRTMVEMHKESGAAATSGDFERAFQLQRDAYALGQFSPVMILSSPEGLQERSISEQLLVDQDSFLAVCEAALSTLLPEQGQASTSIK